MPVASRPERLRAACHDEARFSMTQVLLPPELVTRLERLHLVTRKVFHGRFKGERRSRRKGQSVEFADYRDYVPGDDLRFIDWNGYARLDRLYLKLFLEEEDIHFYVLLDASESMNFGEPTKLQWAVRLAAALGFVGLVRGDRVSVQALRGSSVEASPVLRGRVSVPRLVEFLDQLAPGGPTELAPALKRFCLANSGKGIVVLISDLLDKSGYQDALRTLLAREFDIYVVHVLSQEELDPDLSGDLRLLDAEDADAAEVTVTAGLLRRYRQTVENFRNAARVFCTRRGMAYLGTDNTAAVEDVVLRHLRQRGLVQ